ncbi:hypothetical protein NOCA2310181 [metagenome]|uniref:Uncharacterized protein n=1 Tax=metagenome TaxID=256318 RepID=A0A2P2C2C2_9ZZZZ
MVSRSRLSNAGNASGRGGMGTPQDGVQLRYEISYAESGSRASRVKN